MNYTFSDKTSGLKPSIIREILKQMSDPNLISFAGGNPDSDSFPVNEIADISKRLLANEAASILQYSLTEGVPLVREAAANFANRKGKIMGESDELIIVSGSQQLLDLTARILCNEGDVVATEEPAFLGAYNAFRSAGAVLKGVPIEKDGVNISALESVFASKPTPKFFYCIPNFQNPTGSTMSAAKRKAVYELSVKYNVPILEDDPYGELRVQGEDISPIKALDSTGNVIYAASLSKILSPAMRVAYCIAPKEIIAKLVIAKQVNDVHTNVWAQRVCGEMLAHSDIDAHIAKIRALYFAKAQMMISALRTKCPLLDFAQPEGGMFIWASIKGAQDAEPFISACLKRKLALIPGRAFMVDDNAPAGTLRINFSAPSAEQIMLGTDIMGEVMKELY